MKPTRKMAKAWAELRRRYNNTYIDVVVLQELNKKGVKLIA
jgi:hypothetical protein|tara:strand:- start:512 stop:634 length:123 start_codon:yes stop_codon:yes gene_type:complete